jgi:hypothetical protein
MTESPEIPEAKDPFERRVALSIAVLAVILSIVATIGDDAKLEGLLSATRASNSWAYFQAKSIKEHSFLMQGELLEAVNSQAIDNAKRAELLGKYQKEMKRYGNEKEEIQKKAEDFEKLVELKIKANDRCDMATMLLQIAIVFGSVSILVRWKAFWGLSLLLGLAGILTAATIFF